VEDIAYERYKTVISKEEFYRGWTSKNTEYMSETLKEYVYQQYVLKCLVFQRDGFKCINLNCKTPTDALTMHHIKFTKNGGKDTPRNCATICKPCHQGFHKGKMDLTFWNATYKLHQEDKLNWKAVKSKQRKFRKELKMSGDWSVNISPELFMLLMKFLELEYNELFEGDDD
jgi:5-methylcytosine-specific restriction endonuclease McrA